MENLPKVEESLLEILYENGSLVFQSKNQDHMEHLKDWVIYDPRILKGRAKAHHYRNILLKLSEVGLKYEDKASSYNKKLNFDDFLPIVPRNHQKEAFEKWMQQKEGIVILPTGAGKTILAVMLIHAIKRSTLVVVPTIDLLHQWQKVLEHHFKRSIGTIGGGDHDIKEITISTYDSARIFSEKLGNSFGFLIFDECHHLPAPFYMQIAINSLAPYRLGLTATLDRADGRHEDLFPLIGPVVYEGHIRDMGQGVLAPYEVISIEVALTLEEKALYDKTRSNYINFARKLQIPLSEPGGWQRFIFFASRSLEGKKAMMDYRTQKKLAQAASGKFQEVWKILNAHHNDPAIIFTDDNELAYNLGRQFILPVLTHKTPLKERKQMLADFRSGELKVLVTSKVLNEGVDVPEAKVGIVVSGSGAVREHVQRLGRILRQSPGKKAVLYELIAKDTNEGFINQRRKQHDAYRR